MFDIIERFTKGELSDEQCQHCLSATNLGKQYVFKSNKALNSLEFLNKCFISSAERKDLSKTLIDKKKVDVHKKNVERLEKKAQQIQAEKDKKERKKRERIERRQKNKEKYSKKEN